MTDQRVLGGAIRAIRERSGIGLRSLARDIGVSPGFLSDIETGQKQPSVKVREKIRARLGVSLDAIMFDADADTRRPVRARRRRSSEGQGQAPAGAA